MVLLVFLSDHSHVIWIHYNLIFMEFGRRLSMEHVQNRKLVELLANQNTYIGLKSVLISEIKLPQTNISTQI